MFFLLHGLIIGYGLLALACKYLCGFTVLLYAQDCSCKKTHHFHTDVNAGIGVYIYGKGRTDFGDLTLLWIYVGFAAFSLVLTCVLFAVFTGEAIIFKRDGEWGALCYE